MYLATHVTDAAIDVRPHHAGMATLRFPYIHTWGLATHTYMIHLAQDGAASDAGQRVGVGARDVCAPRCALSGGSAATSEGATHAQRCTSTAPDPSRACLVSETPTIHSSQVLATRHESEQQHMTTSRAAPDPRELVD